MEIKVLGSGCTKCKKLNQNAILAADELGIDAKVVYIKDFAEIAKYNVMQTPALVIENEVVSKGKVLSKQEIKQLLESR